MSHTTERLTTEMNNALIVRPYVQRKIIQQLAATVYRLTELNEQQSLLLATAFVNVYTKAMSFMGPILSSKYADMVGIMYNRSVIVADGERVAAEPIEDIYKVLRMSHLLVSEDTGLYGAGWTKALNVELESRPTPSYLPIIRRRGYGGFSKHQAVRNPINVLEKTVFNIDMNMLNLARAIYNEAGDHKELKADAYVVRGCDVLADLDNGIDEGFRAEFFADLRGRMYQGDFHGPNSQSGDLARSLMDLQDVAEYDNAEMVDAITTEMKDMCDEDFDDNLEAAISNPIQFIKINTIGEGTVSKPWSFVKAAITIKAIADGEKPVVGMAFGLDAKSSGPQIGAMLTGDNDIAAAAGFTLVKKDDTYELAAQALTASGFTGMVRKVVKKPYMAVFYGQAWQAFTEIKNGDTDGYNELITLIQKINLHKIPADLVEQVTEGKMELVDAQAQYFHRVVEASFGKKIAALRKLIKDSQVAGYEGGKVQMHTNAPIKYLMPDGLEVAMRYKVRKDIFGEVTMKKDACDVSVETGFAFAPTLIHAKLSFETTEAAIYDHARTGFVNLIQACDGYLARLIVGNMGKVTDNVVVSIHDCFRTSGNAYIDGKLHEAIKQAYRTFQQEKDGILTSYFTAVEVAGGVVDWNAVSEVQGDVANVDYLIDMLDMGDGKGGSYYFCK